MPAVRHDFRPAILRAIAQRGRTKAQLISYLGAQDAWDRVDYDLRRLRIAGFIEYSSVVLVGADGRRTMVRAWMKVRCGQSST